MAQTFVILDSPVIFIVGGFIAESIVFNILSYSPSTLLCTLVTRNIGQSCMALHTNVLYAWESWALLVNVNSVQFK